MQDFLVGLVSFPKDLADLLLDLSGGAGRLGDELDQVARVLQERLDLGYIGKIISATIGRDGQVTGFLDEEAGAPKTLNSGNETGHQSSFGLCQREATQSARRTSEFKGPTFLTISFVPNPRTL